MNVVTLVGRLGQDPQQRDAGGKVVASFSIATRAGKDQADWHNIECWEKTAELCISFLEKGKQVAVQGRLKTDEYEKDGVKVYRTKVVAHNVEFLSPKSETSEALPNAAPTFDSTEQTPF